MSSTLRISLKSGDRIFINGAVLRADRKVTLEILNEVTFLLEHHFLSEQEATTPLRRLYFLVQTMLTHPDDAGAAQEACAAQLLTLCKIYQEREAVEKLNAIAIAINACRPFEALKIVRTLFPLEGAKMARSA